MKKCPKCGTVSDNNFCPDCGANLADAQPVYICPVCGAESDSVFCPECGTKIIPGSAPAMSEPEEGENNLSGNDEKPKKKGVRILIALLIVALLAAAAVIFKDELMYFLFGEDYQTEETDKNSIDYVEPEDMNNNFTVRQAVVTLLDYPDEWEYDKWDTEDTGDIYAIYPEGLHQDKMIDILFIECFHDSIKGATTSEQIAAYYEFFEPDFLKAYPNAEVVKREHITRSGQPAYHLVLHDDKEKVTYDDYFFMANDTDLLLAMKVHRDEAQTDYDKLFLKFIRSIQTTYDQK